MARFHYTFDANLQLKDAGLIAASAAWQVASVDKILDLGLGLVEGNLVIDVTAIEIASNDELYILGFQLSNSATFASGIVESASLTLGALEVIGGDTDSAVGRYILKIRNELNGTIYRYARGFTTMSGTIATGLNHSAYLAIG